jgi:CheY-like chemotaxis protein
MAKILIVDDEATIRELFNYVFEDAGYEVALANDGRQALTKVRQSIPDFIILDVAMPEMTGKEFVVELKHIAARDRRYVGIPFVVMTGENFMESELNSVFASAPGFICFFPKMTPPEIVRGKVEEVLKGGGR